MGEISLNQDVLCKHFFQQHFCTFSAWVFLDIWDVVKKYFSLGKKPQVYNQLLQYKHTVWQHTKVFQARHQHKSGRISLFCVTDCNVLVMLTLLNLKRMIPLS